MHVKTTNAVAQRSMESLRSLHAPQTSAARMGAAFQLRSFLQQHLADTDTGTAAMGGAILAMAGKQLRIDWGIGSTSRPLWVEVQGFPSTKLTSLPATSSWPSPRRRRNTTP